MVKSYEKQAKSKADIAKEKSLVTKQRIKEKEKAATKSEKKDLDAAHKRVTGGGIHAGKPPKGGKDIIVSTPEKHPAHDPQKGGIHAGKPPKGEYKKPPKNGGAQAAEVEIKKKPLSPEQKKKDKAIMKAEKARRAKVNL